jgi:hypothetical protein
MSDKRRRSFILYAGETEVKNEDPKRKTGTPNWMKIALVMLPEAYIEGLEELVRLNIYPSRSAAIRVAVRDLLKRELWLSRKIII